MWVAAMALWMVVFWAGVVMLALWVGRLVLPQAEERQMYWVGIGGAVLVLSTLVTMVMFAAPYARSGPGGVPLWMSHMGWGGWFPAPSAEQVVHPTAGVPTIQVDLLEFAFQPRETRITGWQPVNLELVNRGAILHAVAIPKLGAQITLRPGERKVVRLDWLKAGTYEFYCSIPSHREAGMVGRFIVGLPN